MKHNLLALTALLCLCAQPAVSLHAQTTKSLHIDDDRRARSKGWRLVWADEFDGPAIDASSWSRCPVGNADWMRHMSPLDSLCRVENGTLRLYGVCRPDGADDPRPYLTGGVQSKGKRSIRLGRVDVRARFDCAQGFWPAIWLMPDRDMPWPSGGEIDIMEHLNHDTIAYQTVHSPHTLEHREPEVRNSSTGGIDRDGFNVYSTVVTQYGIEFYINGRHTYTYPRTRGSISVRRPSVLRHSVGAVGRQLGRRDRPVTTACENGDRLREILREAPTVKRRGETFFRIRDEKMPKLFADSDFCTTFAIAISKRCVSSAG